MPTSLAEPAVQETHVCGHAFLVPGQVQAAVQVYRDRANSLHVDYYYTSTDELASGVVQRVSVSERPGLVDLTDLDGSVVVFETLHGGSVTVRAAPKV